MDKTVEVPIVKKVHKFVEVPTVQYIDKVVDVPRITTIEKVIEIPKNEFIEIEEETRYEQVDLGTEQIDAPVEREEITVAGEAYEAIAGQTFHQWDHSVRPPAGVISSRVFHQWDHSGVQQPMLLNSVNTPANSQLGGSASQLGLGGSQLGGSMLGLNAAPSFVSQPSLVNRSSTAGGLGGNMLNVNNDRVSSFKDSLANSSTLNKPLGVQMTLPTVNLSFPTIGSPAPMLGNIGMGMTMIPSPLPSPRLGSAGVMPLPPAPTEVVI